MPIVEFSNTIAYNAQSPLQTPLRQLPFENGSLKIKSTPLGGCVGLFLKNFFSNFLSHIKDSNGAENIFLSFVQAVIEVLKKSHFNLQMGNCPIPIAEDSGQHLESLDPN